MYHCEIEPGQFIVFACTYKLYERPLFVELFPPEYYYDERRFVFCFCFFDKLKMFKTAPQLDVSNNTTFLKRLCVQISALIFRTGTKRPRIIKFDWNEKSRIWSRRVKRLIISIFRSIDNSTTPFR